MSVIDCSNFHWCRLEIFGPSSEKSLSIRTRRELIAGCIVVAHLIGALELVVTSMCRASDPGLI